MTTTYKKIGKKLKRARKSIGLSQEQVARKLELARPTISKIENGERKINSVELTQFADLYRRSLSYFLEPKKEEKALAYLLRAEKVTQKERKELIETYNLYKEYAHLERLVFGQIPFHLAEYNLPSRSTRRDILREGEKLAKNERKRLGLDGAPIKDTFKLLEKQKIKLFQSHFGRESDISGCFFFDEEDGPCIVVNVDHSKGRANFSAAHEYGHFLRDRSLFPAHASRVDNERDTREKKIEMRANAFAAAFLMPESGVNEFFEEVDINKGDRITPEDVVFIKEYFGVSYEAMLYRLLNLDWINEERRKQLSTYSPGKIAKKLGIEKEDREEKPSPLPTRFIHLSFKAYELEKINLGKLVEYLSPLGVNDKEVIEALQSLDIKVRLGAETEEEVYEEIENA